MPDSKHRGRHRLRFALGAVLAASAATELLAQGEAMRLHLSLGLLFFGCFRMLAALAVLLEGAEAIADHLHRGLYRALRSRWVELVAGVALAAGSAIELVRNADTALESLGAHHGAMALALFSILLALAHLLAGARKLAGEDARSLAASIVGHRYVDIAIAVLVVVACTGELLEGHLHALTLHSTHGLLVFAVGHLFELALSPERQPTPRARPKQ